MDVYELIDIEVKKSILHSSDYDTTELLRLLDIVYDYIYECRDADLIRKSINKISNIFHSVGDNSVVVLTFVLMNKLSDLNGIKILKYSESHVEPDLDKLKEFIKNEIIENNGVFDFFNHKKGSTTLGKNKLYASVLSMLRHNLQSTIKDDVDINCSLVLLINMWILSPKVDRLYEFYIIFCSFLHKLHLSQKTQMVRDLAETALVLGFRDKRLNYSFYVRMAVYSRQYNVIDSLLSAQLMLHGYNYIHQENEIFLSKSLLELAITLRNFRLYPFVERVKQAHDQLNIEDRYDKHQFDMAIFNMKLLMEDEGLFELVDEYLNDNDVLEFDVASGIPWIVLLLNLKRSDISRFENYQNLIQSLSRLESNEEIYNNPVVEDYRKAMSSTVSENKEAVQKGISNILQSRSFTDVNYELTMLQPAVINLLKNSIASDDIEGVLIAHSLSSGASGFDISTEEAMTEFSPLKKVFNISSPTIFDGYLIHLSKLIEQSDMSVFIWVGCCDDFCYSVSLKERRFSLYINDTFNKNDLRNWEATQTELLAFNDQPNLESILDSNINHWEFESRVIIESLPALTDIHEARNIVLFRDVNMSHLPSNLIKTTAGILLADLAPLHTPSTVESYIKSESFIVGYKNIKLWAPVEEGDFAINIAYDKIQSLFNDASLLKITSLDSRIELNTDINIFISHGGKDGLYGFKSISPAEGKYFINENDVFGRGKVAILFICHSGSSKSSMFATKPDGLVSKILELGYECVLAPAWSYNVILTGIWTRSFVDALNDGKNLSESTYYANKSVKSEYPGVGAYAAMHLFGNDGLILVNDRS
ncbi:hypothetical protein ACXDJJ_001092 [Klebsiella quasipneumoniae]